MTLLTLFEEGVTVHILARVMVGLQPVSSGEALFKGQPLSTRDKWVSDLINMVDLP